MLRFIQFLALVLAIQLNVGCAIGGSAGMGRHTEFQLSDNLTLVVRELQAGEDFYRVIVGFKESTQHNTVIQEVSASNSYGLNYAIVESFETSGPLLAKAKKTLHVEATEWDIHSAKGVSGWEHRSMNFYTGEVDGVHRNPLGFAILPENFSGQFRTEIPEYVNEHHQKKYAIAGAVIDRHEEVGSYEIYWEPNKVILMTPVGGLVYERGRGTRIID